MTTSHSVNVTSNLLQFDEYFIENVYKCQVIPFTHKKHIPLSKLTLSNRELGWASEIIYLGVTLDRTVTFRKYIKNINSKAIGKIKTIQHLLIHRSFTLKSKTFHYTSLVRPVISYASPAWCTLSKTHPNTLKKKTKTTPSV